MDKKRTVFSVLRTGIIVISLMAVAFCVGYFTGIKHAETTITITQLHTDSGQSSPSDGEGFRININTAEHDLLTSIPGVGDTLARRIIEYRDMNGPFTDVSDIMNVDGIGWEKYMAMKDYITVD